ncbi:MAG: hypothetical protein Q4F63_00690 [Clostridia bacterium]|nr:hypothetical protein [Clostridia bacterium]
MNNNMSKKKKDFLIGLMYNDGDLAHLSEGSADCIGEGFIDFKEEPIDDKES